MRKTWPAFTPPQWPRFRPPLTADSFNASAANDTINAGDGDDYIDPGTLATATRMRVALYARYSSDAHSGTSAA